MTLTPEQVGVLFTVVTGLLIALTNYLTHLSTTQKMTSLKQQVSDVHAMVAAGQAAPEPTTPSEPPMTVTSATPEMTFLRPAPPRE